jgi:hypothetical protein
MKLLHSGSEKPAAARASSAEALSGSRGIFLCGPPARVLFRGIVRQPHQKSEVAQRGAVLVIPRH